jgi:hypothetical protein
MPTIRFTSIPIDIAVEVDPLVHQGMEMYDEQTLLDRGTDRVHEILQHLDIPGVQIAYGGRGSLFGEVLDPPGWGDDTLSEKHRGIMLSLLSGTPYPHDHTAVLQLMVSGYLDSDSSGETILTDKGRAYIEPRGR